MRGCEATYSAGTLHCERCQLWWDANDKDRPDCLTSQQVGRMNIDKIIKEVLTDETNIPVRERN